MSEVAHTLIPAEPGNATAITPMEMIERAVVNGAGIDVLERLMTLQERYEAALSRKAFDRAIADAKAELPTIIKNRRVGFESMKGKTNYAYEDLAAVTRTIDPILSKHGLSYRFRSTQDGPTVTVACILSHRDGFSEETSLSANNDTSGNKNGIQAIGSAVTYLQRYTLKLALGLAAAQDGDANGADPDERISEDQLNDLIETADRLDVDKARFCEWAKVESLAEIRRADFQKAKNAILAKGKANV